MADKIQRFSQLIVWQKAHQLALVVYQQTKTFPAEEKFGLVSQMRRAAVSIPANIAEGFKKRGLKNKINFYNIAQSSLEELRYYIILSRDLGYLKEIQKLWEQTREVAKMLTSLIKVLDEKLKKPEKEAE